MKVGVTDAGAALIVTEVAADVHPALFLTVTLYVPGATLLNKPVVFVYVVPSMLYVIPAAGAGVFTVIIPVAREHVGWVGVTVGAAGAAGAGFIVTDVAEERQPLALFTVTL